MGASLISVIVPVHNAAGTLEAAVSSVLAQTFSDFELILVDDGGTDGSPLLCEGLAQRDRRIRVFHMEDRGVSAARNLGLDAARGGRIAFLDADDILHPSMLQALSDLLDETGADYAGCGFEKRHEGEAAFGAQVSCLNPVLTPGGTHSAEKSAEEASPKEPGYSAPAEGSGDEDDAAAAEAAKAGAEKAGAGVTAKAGAGKAGAEMTAKAGAANPESGCSGGFTQLRGPQIIVEGTLHPTHPDTRVWSKLFCREYIGKTRFREGLTIGEDMLFLVELAREESRYVQVPDEMYSYYINPHGAMERPFAPNHMDTIRCRDLAEDVIRERFPAIAEDPDGAARLAAQQLIAAVLTASKIARLPSGEQARYEKEFEACRECILRHYRVKGAGAYLPRGYALKIQLLLHAPGVYRKLYR